MANPATYLARCSFTNDHTRANGKPASISFVKVTKTGRVNDAHSIAKATRFDSKDAAQAAITARMEYVTRVYKLTAADVANNVWTIVEA